MSNPPKSSRAGTLGVLAIFAALVAAYFGNCLTGLGIPGPGPTPTDDAKPAAKTATKASDGDARAHIVVTGEQCRLGDATPGDCKAVCEQVAGKAAELDATAGAQRTVDALRTCLQGRGIKVSVLSE